MENKDISQIALEKIKESGMKPISRKVFSVKRVLFWTVVGISFIVGALAFALILAALFNNDWDLYNKFGFNFILKTLPYFWLISLGIFIILGERYYRKTLLGHRHGLLVVVGVYLISTTFFGSIFYIIGIGDAIEESLSGIPPIYENIILNHEGIWSNPDVGLLSGKVILVGNGEIHVIDRNGFIWVVNDNSATIRGNLNIVVGEKVKIMGDKTDKNFFKAEEIRQW